MRILLVDDDATFSEILSEKLGRRANVSVTVASSAEHALRLVAAQKSPFDCFLLDIMLGGIDGIELCRRLRAARAYKTAPVIMMTASQETPLMERAFKAGATDFLRKPLSEVELAGRITTAMMLVEAMKREKAGRHALRSALSSKGSVGEFDISERVCFSDVPRMMEYHELENCLLRLNDGLYNLSVFRILIPGFQKSGITRDRAQILQRLHAISKSISDAVPPDALMMSYIGRGRFTCCIFGRSTRVSGIFQNDIQANICSTLGELKINFDNLGDLSVERLSDHPILSRSAAVALVRSEFELVRSFKAEHLPDESDVADNIFLDIDRPTCNASAQS